LSNTKKEDALTYHSRGRKGKITVNASKPCRTEEDLSLAYTPGVAYPVREIVDDAHDAYQYTDKGNLVGIISNGTAVLGLGDLGPLASKPVMEGKGVLFKRFADIDAFDIEVDATDPGEIIHLCRLIEPTFGGINLEDIKAPECFFIEDELKKTLRIPVFHDDQHGTAVITAAALINALEIVGKGIGDVNIVINGAGAAGIACAKFLFFIGVSRRQIVVCDSRGVLYKGRSAGMNTYKEQFAVDTPGRSVADVMVGADVFIGNSVAGAVTPEMLQTMAPRPIVFAMANPDPEIDYETATRTRTDAVVATGRSDCPNQVNNVLGFPFIFRGAFDTEATTINNEMMRAASMALARLARKDVPPEVRRAYGGKRFSFGRDYIIPKPFDPRVLPDVATAVAQAAIDTGVAVKKVDIDDYRTRMEKLSIRINRLAGDFVFERHFS
jgi:malate dehydrogenase (oxaloacetate-decarboxylating)(NADP+)